MKRWIAILVTFMFIICYTAGCGTSVKTETEGNSNAENWPQEPITMVIAYSAGGASDVVARQIAKSMQSILGTNINCINVGGASGSVAGQQVLDAPADGYTIFGGLAHSPSGWKMLNYADISWDDYYGFYAATSPYVLFVKEGGKYQTYQALIEDMKANPGMLKWGNAGLGSINHLTGEMFLDIVGCTATSLPYDGGRDAAIKVIADEVQFSWAGAADVMDLAETGEIKVLGVVAPEPLQVTCAKGDYEAPSLLTDYPELEKLQNLLYWGFAVNRQTPPEIVKKLEDTLKVVVEDEEFKKLCEDRYMEPKLLIGEESDKTSAYLESIYAWGLADNGLAAEGITPEQFDIPRPEEFEWPSNERAEKVNPWPAA